MKKFLSFLICILFSCWVLAGISFAQTEPVADPRKPASVDAPPADPSAAKPMAFWAATPPGVSGNLEVKYDINGDGILQTSEVKVFLRQITAQVQKDNINFNIADSLFLRAYDKNHDGIISKLELNDIKKDLSY